MCAAPWASCHRPPCFGSRLGLMSLSENLQRKFLGACSWEVALIGPLSPGGYGGCHQPSVGANGLPEAKIRGKLSLVQIPPRGVLGLLLPSAGGAFLCPQKAPRFCSPLRGRCRRTVFRPKKGCLWVGGSRKSQLGRVDLNGPKEADESLGLAKGPQFPTGSHLPVPPPANLREGNRSGGKERKDMF